MRVNLHSDPQRKSRILMPTFSAFEKSVFRSGLAEAQDVLANCDDVDFIRLEPAAGFDLKRNFLRKLVRHDVSRRTVFLNPGLRPVRLERDYELFVLVCPWWEDVAHANAIVNWRDRCRTSVCWIDELWAQDVSRLNYWLPILTRFDHVFVGILGSGQAVSRAIGRPCREIVGGVDAIRFSPYPNPPPRVIDILSIGRRMDAVHRALLDLASDAGLFYMHDTTANSGNNQVNDFREHRNMFANAAKRSRLFTVMPGKVNVVDETRGQPDLGFRYFEGAAAGAVMVGKAPRSPEFRRYFDWPDSVIEIEPDGSNAREVILALLAQPDRLADIGARNAEGVLRRHDWVYRWKEIYETVGLQLSQAMKNRERQLFALAEQIKERRSHPTSVAN